MNKIVSSLFLAASLLAQDDTHWLKEETLPLDEESRLFLKEMYVSPVQEECCQRPVFSEKEGLEAGLSTNQTETKDAYSAHIQTWEVERPSNHPDIQLSSKQEEKQKVSLGDSHELCLVFVSFSLPLESWKEFSCFLEKVHGSFVLCGIPGNSFSLFSKKVQELRKEGIQASIEINPDAFEQYDVQAVPALVVVSQNKNDKITGNISPEAALSMIEEKGETADFAKRLQKQIKKET